MRKKMEMLGAMALLLLISGCEAGAGNDVGTATMNREANSSPQEANAGANRAAPPATSGANPPAFLSEDRSRVPATIALTLSAGENAAAGAEALLQIALTPQRPLRRVEMIFDVKGATELEQKSAEFRALSAGAATTEELKVKIGAGASEVAVKFTGYGPQGDEAFSTTRTLYILADEQTVYSGQSGPLEIQRRKLEQDYRDGKISEEDYKQKKRILSF